MNEHTDNTENLDEISKKMRELVLIMKKLRNKESGCEWDLKQTYNTIAPYTIEEAYEVAEAIYENDMDKLCDELGDLLLQVVFHSQIAYELGDFKLEDVIAAVCDKMIRRHPHIFGNKKEKDITSIRKTWEEIKQQEREEKSQDSDFLSMLDGVSNNLPALMRALKLQQRVSKVGFDWPDLYSAIDKMYEEINELKKEIEQEVPDQSRIQDEIGDIFFAATNIARHAGCEPETSLIHSNRKFEKRFRQLEKEIRKNDQSIENLSLDQLETLWKKAKKVVG